jgi:large-conductance mechanosensitive channel
MFCYETFRSFMFANKIAGASVAFAIGLASAEFAKSLTLKAVIPFLQRLLRVYTRSSAKSVRTTLVTSALWVYIGYVWGVLFYIEYIFGRFLLGTATVLSKDEKDDESCTESSLQEPSTLQVVKNTVSTITGREGFEEENHPLISTTSCYLVIF